MSNIKMSNIKYDKFENSLKAQGKAGFHIFKCTFVCSFSSLRYEITKNPNKLNYNCSNKPKWSLLGAHNINTGFVTAKCVQTIFFLMNLIAFDFSYMDHILRCFLTLYFKQQINYFFSKWKC